jgi:hypothetical protein
MMVYENVEKVLFLVDNSSILYMTMLAAAMITMVCGSQKAAI